MALTKIEYTDNKTIIGAENLNMIQDAIVALEAEVAALKAVIETLPQMELDSESSTPTLKITGLVHIPLKYSGDTMSYLLFAYISTSQIF